MYKVRNFLRAHNRDSKAHMDMLRELVVPPEDATWVEHGKVGEQQERTASKKAARVQKSDDQDCDVLDQSGRCFHLC